MTFAEAVGKCFRKYAIFKGRASRREYWWFALAAFLVQWPLLMVTFETGLYQILEFIYFALTVLVFLPQLAVFVRRLHDGGHSAWNCLWVFIPVIGWIRVFVLLVRKGDPEPNQFGDPDNLPFTPAGTRTKIEIVPETQTVEGEAEAVANG